MKFFTLDHYHNKSRLKNSLELREWKRISEAYRLHLEALRDRLPVAVLELTELNGVDDALIVEVEFRREEKWLRLTLRAGHLQMGYYDLILTYEGAKISRPNEWILAKQARLTDGQRGNLDLAYHEIDLTTDGKIEHRLLFHPGRYISIRCRALHWEKVNRPNRDLPTLPDRFPGGITTTLYRRRKLHSDFKYI